MSKYMIRDVQEKDIKAIVDIYNSNYQFLFHHLGVKSVDETFMIQEISTMRKLGFRPSVIVNQENVTIQGILDYKLEQEVYLSLIMLSKDLQGNGTGSSLYSCFESKMIQDKRDSIRIDVVNDYQKNLVSFWKKHGFEEAEEIVLSWGNKKSKAVVMKKYLR
ncbi:hypothetical protein HMPREF0389_00059 [Filifactor alocis ATCC 35896]|jgi:hypothetical protein|uniref:N-acetyltransferase domain-containing protein n=1 Tax=Filifactor alocis (strain ATCC 35896 / CCUG 47790 / D40 B5) TaxID=546269 RepID=D6GR55_FILAD|nr:GNAT family N-acetyltransferase [Filifactor alocis]EFE28146.1 hypothetical protein HMPREF0389_00059 [Filifactor alocis ATCC 35896]